MTEYEQGTEQGLGEDHLDRAYLDTFTSGPGTEVLEDLWGAYFEVPMLNPNDLRPDIMLAFREGQRSIVLHIRSAMRRAQSGTPGAVATKEDLIR